MGELQSQKNNTQEECILLSLQLKELEEELPRLQLEKDLAKEELEKKSLESEKIKKLEKELKILNSSIFDLMINALDPSNYKDTQEYRILASQRDQKTNEIKQARSLYSKNFSTAFKNSLLTSQKLSEKIREQQLFQGKSENLDKSYKRQEQIIDAFDAIIKMRFPAIK